MSRTNPYKLPVSDESTYEPYVMPKECQRILVLPDIHVPYHNIEAITAAIDYGKKQEADTILINGDFLDCYSISSFEKDPRKRRFSEELQMGKEILRILREQFPDAHMVYQLGNHEDRYERFMKSRAHELLGIEQFEIESILEADKFQMDVVRDKRYVIAGDLTIMHGHEMGGGGGTEPAKALLKKTKTSSLCGHHHHTSEYSERDIRGRLVTCWSMGCLSELTPAYRPINRYNHGFAFVQVTLAGTFYVSNKRIHKGRVV